MGSMTNSDAEIIDQLLRDVKDNDGIQITGNEYEIHKHYIKYVYDNGFVEKVHFFVAPNGCFIAGISSKGIMLLNSGGFKEKLRLKNETAIQKEELDILTKENLKLQNEELRYKETIRKQESAIRRWQIISGLLAIATFGLSIYSIFFKG